ncbi:MAG: VWA domain-containing protein [Acidimicrobiia bacterium]|nr:VWA domain-containing protein [Acidimicrobiia bacterium]
MALGRHHRYSRWDGTQTGFELDATDVFSEITDDLLYHGDLNSALRRMLQSGFDAPDGSRIEGLRDMLERLREQRRERLDRYDLGGVYDDIAERLRDVVDTERQHLDQEDERAQMSGNDRVRELTESANAERRMNLDMLSPDLAGMVRDLQSYDFSSDEARRTFDELVEQLRTELMQSYVNRMAGAMENLTPEQLGRMKDMMAELNHMLDQRAAGEEPDFEGFMERYGDFFPENPQTLDELLEVMARRMAAMQSMLNSMTPEQRAQLQGLSEQLLEDMDLRWQADQLGSHLQQMFPQMGWDRSYDFSGQDPLSMGDAADILGELGDLDQLENLLRGAANPGALAEVDIDRARELLGEEAANSLEHLSKLAKTLEEAGLMEQRDGRWELTPRGVRRIGQNALSDLFRKLDAAALGGHAVARTGTGHERDVDTKPYEYGDPFNLQIERTVRNAVARSGAGVPVRLAPEDFEVERTEHITRSNTVLLLDLSLSMPMRDNFLPAKKVAMALHSLISSQFPRDYLGIVGFSDVAVTIRPEQLPEVAWDFRYGTNMQHALQLARQQLGRQRGTKQVIMITDGEPTAHIDANGEPFFSYPPVRETVDATLREVARCTRDDIRINVFMLDPTPHLRAFVERITEMNRGRAFFTTPENLGDYVLVDFLEHRRSLRSDRRAG